MVIPKEGIQGRLCLVQEAIQDYQAGKLSAESALAAIALIIQPVRGLTPEEKEYGRQLWIQMDEDFQKVTRGNKGYCQIR